MRNLPLCLEDCWLLVAVAVAVAVVLDVAAGVVAMVVFLSKTWYIVAMAVCELRTI